MMERFKRGGASEEPRDTGSVATSTEREREAEATGAQGAPRGGTTREGKATTDDDRTMVGDRTTTGDDRTLVRDRDRDFDGDAVADDRGSARTPVGERTRE